MKIKSPTKLLILLLLAALAGMLLVGYATSQGPGVGGDATIYLTSARNFLSGQGLGWQEADGTFRLLPYTPPFYPIVLSGAGLLVKDIVSAARWLNILLFGCTVALIGWFLYRTTGRLWLAALLAGVLATSPVLLGVQVWAMSEPLFLLLGFAGLITLLAYLERPRAPLLLAAALLCGLAFLTRYIGAAFVATGGLALLFFDRGQERRFHLRLDRRTLAEAFFFGALALLPVLIWMAIDFSITGTVSSRSGQPAAAYWQRFLEMCPALEGIYLFWLIPDSIAARLPNAVRLLLWLVPLVGLTGLILVGSRTSLRPVSATASTASRRAAAVLGLFILVYLIVMAGVHVLTYPPITLASRMLSPVHLAALVLLFILAHLGLHLVSGNQAAARALTAVVYLGCLALFGSYALRSVLIAREYHRTGIGYMSPAWQNSATVQAARALPANVPIISNEATAIMFFLDRPAYVIQEIYQDQPQAAFTPYGAGDDPAQIVFREQGGALVLFNNTLYDDFAMYGERIEARIQALTSPLNPYFESEDGGIYFFGSSTVLPKDDGN